MTLEIICINRFCKRLSDIQNFFFINDPNEPYKPLPPHRLEQSPCYPIILTKRENNITWYYCKLHPKTEIVKYKNLILNFAMKAHIVPIKSIHLSVIEHHMKYYKPQEHEDAILKALKL